MSDYHIYRTDPTITTPIIIKAYTTNGPASPAFETFYNGGVSANTSLILLGKGKFDYGEPIQNNLVHLLENFANSTAPVYPITGQLWFNNATNKLSVYSETLSTWRELAAVAELSSIYIPTSGGSLDGTLQLSITGKILGLSTPTDNTEATSKLYVDTAIASGIANIGNDYISSTGSYGITGVYEWDGTSIPSSITLQSTNLTLSNSNLEVLGNVALTNSTITLTNSTISGELSVNGNLTIVGSHTIDFGNNIVSGVNNPVLNTDAANKQWVLSQISGGGSADGTLTSGSYNTTTGVLTLSSSISGDITVPGFLTLSQVPTSSGADTDTFNTLSASTDNSWLANALHDLIPEYPNVYIHDAIDQLDAAISYITDPHKRYISTVTTSGVLTITLPFNYTTEQHNLLVTINGIKQYNSVRGYSTIGFPTSGKIVSLLPLDVNTLYTFNVVVDGGASQTITIQNPASTSFNIFNIPDDFTFTVETNVVNQIFAGQKFQANVIGGPFTACSGIYTIVSSVVSGANTNITVFENNQSSTIPPGSGFFPSGTIIPRPLYTYMDLVKDINMQVTGARCVYDSHSIVIYSNTFGISSSVSITDVDLLSTLLTTGITNGPTGVSYGYTENGAVYTQSNSITFIADPGIGAVIEIIDTK